MNPTTETIKLLDAILELEKKESNDYALGGKLRNLIEHFNQTGEIKKDPQPRKL